MNKMFIPNTLNEAIDFIVNHLSQVEIDFIHKNKSTTLHFFEGRNLRNDWGLWEEDTPFKKDIKQRFNLFGMADDCSGLIFAGVWAKVKGLNIDEALNKTAEKYKKHWIKYGVDPVTGKEMPDKPSTVLHDIFIEYDDI